MNEKIQKMQALVADLSRDEIIWLNGYLAGLMERPPQTPPAEGLSVAQASLTGETANGLGSSKSEEWSAGLTPLRGQGGLSLRRGGFTLAYGTETGNAQKLATAFAAKAKKSGVQVKLVSLEQYRFTDLPKEERFYIVISTQGEGEPPIGAKKFYDHLFAGALSLPALHYAVLALGDTAYPLFCKTGEDVDAQLQKLGGKRLMPLQKCDVDYEDDAAKWFETVLQQLQSAPGLQEPAKVQAPPPVAQKPKGKKWY
ncbi:MAG TPA: flavodoxin domain-containing protein, partial [Flavisolibacter sp.]